MRVKQLIMLLMLAFVFSSCSTVRVITDFDPLRDFSNYKTYRWAKKKERDPNDILSKNVRLRKTIQAAIDSVLMKKGFEKIDSGTPDFVVIINGGVRHRVNVYYFGYWYYPWWGPYGGYTTVSHYKEGSLIIDIVDNKDKMLAWRGIATGITGADIDPEYFREDLMRIIEKILKDFPPHSYE